MDQAISVRDRVQAEQLAAQADGSCEPPGEEVSVDGFLRVRGKDAHGDPGMTVVKTPPRPVPVAVNKVHDRAAMEAVGRFLDHLLKDPGMR